MSLASPSVHQQQQKLNVFQRAMLKMKGCLPRVRADTPALHSAVAEFGWNETVAELRSSGARLCEQDADGNTALHVSFLKYGEAIVVDLLMNEYPKETTENLANRDGLSFLHMACTRPCTEFLEKVLTDERVNVDCQVNPGSSSIYAGYSPLHFAVKFGQHEVAELLLARHEADVYVQDREESTPLHLALEHGDVEMLDLLLAYDRRRENVLNKHGLSHFMAACAGSVATTVIEYLQAAPLQTDHLIYTAVVDDAPRFAGYMAVHFANEFARRDTVRLLWICGTRRATPGAVGRGGDDDTWDSEGVESVDDKTSVCVRCFCGVLKLSAYLLFILLVQPWRVL